MQLLFDDSRRFEGKVIAGTGHRPDKLGGYNNAVLKRLTDLARAYLKRETPDFVISGMALGWDTALAVAAIELDLKLIAAVPFKGQESRWQKVDRDTYQHILTQCHLVEIVCSGGYSAEKMQTRNAWMVDNCNILAALWDGTKGGTGNCLEYARKQKVETHNLWKSWVKYK